jgi:excisionase family DNA binding protein
MNNGATLSKENILENEVLTVKEVAVYLRVSRVTVWRWCQRGTLPALRVGRNWRIHRDDLLNLFDKPQPLGTVTLDSGPISESDSKRQALPAIIDKEGVDCTEDGLSSEPGSLDF